MRQKGQQFQTGTGKPMFRFDYNEVLTNYLSTLSVVNESPNRRNILQHWSRKQHHRLAIHVDDSSKLGDEIHRKQMEL